MKNNMKVNIIFDGNYHFHKTMSSFKAYTEAEKGKELNLTQLFEEQESRARFLRKVITDFCSTVRQFENVDKVIFTFDEKSWRQKKYSTYKNKPKSEIELMLKAEAEQGWTHFYSIMNTFKKHVEKKGFITSQLLELEGDDICYFFAKHYSDKNEKSVIVTGDKDILQILNDNISAYRNNSMSPAYFCSPKSSLLPIGEFIKNKVKKLKIEEVDPIKHLFVKILVGDSGDNVPNLFPGLGEKGAEAIFEKAKEINLLDCEYSDLEYITGVAELVKDRFKNKNLDIDKLCWDISTNAGLMWLNKAVYSEEQLVGIRNELTKEYYYNGDFTLSDIL